MSKAQIDFLVRLKRKKYRDQHGKFIIENPKVIFEQYENPLLDSVYVTDNYFRENEDELVFPHLERLSEKDFQRVSSLVSPPGILAIFNMPKLKDFNFKAKQVILLDEIQDPGNMGTILRTADWFGFKDIFLSKNCVEVYNPKVISSTMGSIFNLNIYSELDLQELAGTFQQEKYSLVVSDLAGSKANFNSQQKIALVIGNESKGVNQELKDLADQKIKILKFGQAESLNAAVAAGILMYELKK
ncbi:RNA methyltransferase [Candidatus Nomurabacteria bacterium]|nr:RNA methyltransferase [Candidatus Nomurabacteria bacterium]